MCEFRAKIPAFYRRLQLAAPLRRHSTRSVFLEVFFSWKKWKTSWKLEWNSFFCFTVDEENYIERESAQQQRKGKIRTRRIKLKLCFLSELLCLLFKLRLIFKPAILLNSFIFNCAFRKNRFLVCSSWITSYPYPHYIQVTTNILTNKLILRFGYHFLTCFVVCSGKF